MARWERRWLMPPVLAITAAAAKPAPQATPVGTARAQQEFRTRLKQQLNAISGRVEGLSRAKIGSQPLLAYINLAVALLFVAGMGVFGYMQFIRDTDSPLAYPSALTPPNRTLSFQGRLTDENRNPVPDPTDMRFKLYDDGPAVTGGSLLWDSGTCTIDPDQDGIFSTGLGDECGGAITEDVFTENTNVWLQVEIDNGSEYESSSHARQSKLFLTL